MAEKANVKVQEIYALRNEIKQLLGENLNHIFKLQLIDLFESTDEIVKATEAKRKQLADKYLGDAATQPGAEKHTGFPDFEKSMKEALEDEVPVKYIPIKKSQFDFSSDRVYPTVYKFIEKRNAEIPETV